MKLYGPVAEGVPARMPALLSANPAGGVPTGTDQVIGGIPVVVCNVWENADPFVTVLSAVSVMTGVDSSTEPENTWLVLPYEFVALMVML